MKIPYMIKKRLKDGRVAYYFNLPARLLPEGCDMKRSYSLGCDYLIACREAFVLYQKLKNFKVQCDNFVPASLEHLWAEYIKSKNYLKLTEDTQKYYLYSYNILAEIKAEKSKKMLKEVPLNTFTGQAALNLYESIAEKRGIYRGLACITTLKMLYNFGIRKGIVSGNNPFSNLRISKPKPKKEIIQLENMQEFIRQAREEKRDYLALALELNYYLAQRVGDIRRLRKEHIVEKNGFYFFDFMQNKTGQRVIVPIPQHLWQEVLSKEDYIIADEYGNFTKDRLARHFQRFSEKIGIKIVFKQMRHTASTAYAEAGVPSDAIISITGHTDESTFNRFYKANTSALSMVALEGRLKAENKDN